YTAYSALIYYHFFFNDPATTDIYTLSLHDALPICRHGVEGLPDVDPREEDLADHLAEAARPPELTEERTGQDEHEPAADVPAPRDRKSTRLNSSHVKISYAVFCLKKKKTKKIKNK